MDLLCPTCNDTLTPSAVGYLCVGCGAVHKFYRTDDGTPIDPAVKRQVDSTNDRTIDSIQQLHHSPAPVVNHEASSHYKSRLRRRLKQLIVPELPSPLNYEEITSTERATTNHATYHASSALAANKSAATPTSNSTNTPTPTTQLQPTAATKTLFQPKKIVMLVVAAILLFGAIMIIGAINRPKSSPNTTATSTPTTTTATDKSASSAQTSRDEQRKKDLKEISTALEVYRQEKGTYPVGNDISVVYPLQYANPPYIKYINYDPLSAETEKIKYLYESNGASFTLKAKLENSKDDEAKNGYYIVNNS